MEELIASKKITEPPATAENDNLVAGTPQNYGATANGTTPVGEVTGLNWKERLKQKLR